MRLVDGSLGLLQNFGLTAPARFRHNFIESLVLKIRKVRGEPEVIPGRTLELMITHLNPVMRAGLALHPVYFSGIPCAVNASFAPIRFESYLSICHRFRKIADAFPKIDSGARFGADPVRNDL